MRLSRHLFTVTGAAALLAAVALGGASFSLQGDDSVEAFGDCVPPTSPSATPDPQAGIIVENDLSALGVECTPTSVATEEGPPKTHTPTAETEETPEATEPVSTQPASTSTTAPPVATSTPSGGSQGGGVQPPSTGSNGDAGATGANWLVIAAGLALAIGGTSALGYGLRKN